MQFEIRFYISLPCDIRLTFKFNWQFEMIMN